MPKRKSEKDWQDRHPEKRQEYQAKYMEGKKYAGVVLDGWVLEQIDKVKPPEQSYGGFVRQVIEQWAKQNMTQA